MDVVEQNEPTRIFPPWYIRLVYDRPWQVDVLRFPFYQAAVNASLSPWATTTSNTTLTTAMKIPVISMDIPIVDMAITATRIFRIAKPIAAQAAKEKNEIELGFVCSSRMDANK